MQSSMKNQQLTMEQINPLLLNEKVACIATVNEDGTPYVTPIHYAYKDGKIYFHGLSKGQKIENIKSNPNVSITVYNMDCLLPSSDGSPCNVSTKYQSVIIKGEAVIAESIEDKIYGLKLIVSKYTPDLCDKDIPVNAAMETAVIIVDCKEITGKYYE